MKIFLHGVALAFLASGALATDVVITKTKHTDAATMMGQAQPAKDSTEVTWMGKDHMRVEDGDHVTIVRLDQKKMYMLDVKAKTYSTLELPVDIKKYLPAEYASMIEPMLSQIKVTVTPTTETKKIKDWNATHYTVTMTMPMGGSMTQEIWATKDAPIDFAMAKDASASLMSMNFMTGNLAEEMKKIDGLPVLTERTQTMMGSEVKSKEEVTSIEQKEPAAGLYDVPQGFTEKPFDALSEARGGAGPMGGPGGKHIKNAPPGK